MGERFNELEDNDYSADFYNEGPDDFGEELLDEQYDNEAQDPDGPCASCPWPHLCAARGGCEAED